MFLGMRGTNDWVTDQRPRNWREQILYLYPNGMMPLTALTALMGSESVDDPQYYWWTQIFSTAMGTITGIFTTPDLLNAYVTGGVAGQTLYITISAADAARIRIGHQILLRDASDWSVDVNAKVTNVTIGAIGTVAVVLLEADDNSVMVPANDLSNADSYLVIGNINPEGGVMPTAIALNPVKHYNYTQIFRTSLSITRTARKTKLRTGNDYQKAKREALEMHGIEMELAFWWGIMTERTGDNGKPERTTMGLIPFIRQNAAANCDDFTINPTYAGTTWAASGQTWLENQLEVMFRYGGSERLAVCGSGALLGIQRMVQTNTQYNIEAVPNQYGMDVRKFVTPFGTINFKTHPLFSYDATTRNMMVLFEPSDVKLRYIDDTKFYGENSSGSHPEGYGQGRVDGTDEEWLTECGLEFHHPVKDAVLNGVGLDSVLP
jgi:hypothetical protein